MKVKTIIALIFIFFLLDFTKINDLWGENFHRRILHHLQRGQFNPNKKPWIRLLGKTLSDETINFILNIKSDKDKNCMATISPYLSKLFGGNYSKKCTLYYNDFDSNTQTKLDKIGEAMIPRLEKLSGKKLYLGNSDFRCVLLRYEGADSTFISHYDTEPGNCYRTLFLVKKEGNVPPFIHYDDKGIPQKEFFEEGEGLFFQGTKTFHGVGKTNDPNMVRYMIGWQYTTKPKINDISLCSKLRGLKIFDIFKILLPHLVGTLILSFLFWKTVNDKFTNSQIQNLLITTIIVFVASYNIPKFMTNSYLGTGLSSTFRSIFIITILAILSFGNIFYAFMFINYLLLTEMFFPRTIVGKSLKVIEN